MILGKNKYESDSIFSLISDSPFYWNTNLYRVFKYSIWIMCHVCFNRNVFLTLTGCDQFGKIEKWLLLESQYRTFWNSKVISVVATVCILNTLNRINNLTTLFYIAIPVPVWSLDTQLFRISNNYWHRWRFDLVGAVFRMQTSNIVFLNKYK